MQISAVQILAVQILAVQILAVQILAVQILAVQILAVNNARGSDGGSPKRTARPGRGQAGTTRSVASAGQAGSVARFDNRLLVLSSRKCFVGGGTGPDGKLTSAAVDLFRCDWLARPAATLHGGEENFQLRLASSTLALAEPGRNQLLVVQQGGETDRPSTIWRLSDDWSSGELPTQFLELSARLIYGLTFHPSYRENGYVYVFSNGPTGAEERVNRISRFTVDRSGTQNCDSSSEFVIIEWRSMGHDGGDLAFGHDGMLYITSGDGTSDSDGWRTGQDLRDLSGVYCALMSIIRQAAEPTLYPTIIRSYRPQRLVRRSGRMDYGIHGA